MNVIIADPETRGQCGDSNLGEIWVEVGIMASCSLSSVLIICCNPAIECLLVLMTSSHLIHKSVCSQCPHNASGYYTVFSETDSSYADHFAAR